MKLFRKVIFWLHLSAGLIAGLVIGIMSFTGGTLAFEKEIQAWAERDARRVVPPADAKRLPFDELLKRVRVAQPELRPAGLVINNDPGAAISLSAGGRGGGGGGTVAPSLYANPYTGEVREAQAPRTRAFLRTMNNWHRWLGVEGEHRNIARAATGACNVAFAFLAASGLYLWWPRQWSRRAVRAIALFEFKFSGKARDFNWHNVIGLWSAPVLIVLTVTAFPISYRWAGNLIFTLTATPQLATPAGGPSAPGGGGGGALAAGPAITVPKPSEEAKPLDYDALFAAVQKAAPGWDQVTFRFGGSAGARGGAGAPTAGRGPGGGGRGVRGEGSAREGGPGRESPTGENAEARASVSSVMAHAPTTPASADLPAVNVTVRESNSWPRTATTTLSLDPYTGAVLRRTGYADQTAAQKVRSWTRFLHTGEALGNGGQLVAGLASLGGVVLMYTGFALSWRRFFGRKAGANPPVAV